MNTADRARPLEVVYILGNSFSGSTFLGFLVAATPEVLYLGELKLHNRLRPIACSCGAAGHECPFWSVWDAKGYRLYSGNLRTKLHLAARLLLGLPLGGGRLAPSDDVRFLREISAASGAPRYLLDGSKSIWRLAQLAALDDVRLSVIHVRRSLHANVSSFVKRRGRFWRALASCVLNQMLCERFLARHPELRQLRVEYEAVCDDPERALREIGAFLRLDYGNYREYLQTASFHVRAGNARTIAQARDGLQVSRQPEDWRTRFGPFRTALLDLLARRKGSAGGLTGAP